jgi:hypothetical protein
MRSTQRHCTLVIPLLLAAVQAPALAASPIDFDAQIKPILSDRCFVCHGRDAEHRQAELRLDVRDEALRESSGEAPHIITPGDPVQSELYLRISADDADVRMPPADSKLSLAADEIALIKLWIEQGATWSEHWSFRPLPDRVPVPAVADSQWPRSPIDCFVLQRMRQHRLQPASEADPETLVRRVSFDLTGLPPTLDEIDAFLHDHSDAAYERLVDRLLSSERCGERLASEWLDVARYSDSYGYQVDRDRFVWPWRDWVVRSLNQNLPYDQFITQQLAGDLLPAATDEQILATTFCRLHGQNVEGGSSPEEFRVEYVADRNQTFAAAFLGLTLECARCHEHKYDPITQREYYQLAAFFDNIDEAGLYSYFTDSVPTPTLRLTDAPTRTKMAQLQQQLEQAQQRLANLAAQRRAAFQTWLNGGRLGVDGSSATAASMPNRVLMMDFEDFQDGANQSVDGRTGRAVKLTGDDGIDTKVGNFHRFEPFSVALWVNSPGNKERAVIYHRSRAWTDAASRGYELLLEDDRLSAALVHFWPGNAVRVQTVEPLQPNTWTHVAVTYDGSSRAAGLKIYVDGQPAELEVVRDNLYKEITGGGGDTITIGERFRDRGFADGLVDEFQVYQRQLTELEVAQLVDGHSLADALATPLEHLSPTQQDGLLQYYLATVDEPYRAAVAQLQQLRQQSSAIDEEISEIMVMRELPRRRPTHVLRRGAYDAPAEVVEPLTPASLMPFPAHAPANRLGLARWLCDPRHPLTARVAVNRYWQLIFGEGLVRTPEDFGSQGRPPTHPELLDWLARDFVDHGWDLKRLLKQLVMSATYRQASSADAAARQEDPENLWLSRTSSYRLSAEMIRDNALLVSGLLVSRIGGPPAKPYDLQESFRPSEPDKGDGVYRRSLYTYWNRTGPAPVMMTLDAPKRDVCRVRRERTASPLQALVMFNGPQFVEASRGLGQRLILQHGDDQRSVLVDLFRWLTGHHPDARQVQALDDLYRWQRDYFAAHPAERDLYLQVGHMPPDRSIDSDRLAATAAVAGTLFNYDSCVTKR